MSQRWDILRGIFGVMVPRKEKLTGLLTSRTNSGLVLIQVKEINGKFHMNMSIWGCQLKQHCMCAIAQSHWYIFFLQFHQNTRQRSVKVSVYCNSYLSNAGPIQYRLWELVSDFTFIWCDKLLCKCDSSHWIRQWG